MTPFPNQLTSSFCLALCLSPVAAQTPPIVDTSGLDPECGITFHQSGAELEVRWPAAEDRQARMTFNLDPDRALVGLIEVTEASGSGRIIARELDPTLQLRVGRRDLEKRGGWTIFFDRMQDKPHETFVARCDRGSVTATSHHRRATLTIGEVSAGPFRGHFQWTFFAGSPLVLQEAVLQTSRDGVAYLFDFGFVCRAERPKLVAWQDPRETTQTRPADELQSPVHLSVQGRSLSAEFAQGSLALFPPPHRFFYPLDFSDNLQNIWLGPGYVGAEEPFGFGVRHDPQGDQRYVPWFNAPPGSAQEMGVFLHLSQQSAEQALRAARRWTRSDRYQPLPGYRVFSSHYHVEHTRDLLEHQQQPAAGNESQGMLPGGGRYRIPQRLEQPGFVRTFRKLGVDIVHLAEFHFGRTPRMTREERVERLQLLHAECNRLSDEELLLLPGEEPNVHLGGHWISFFPKPVYWVLNRPPGTPFVEQDETLGRDLSGRIGGRRASTAAGRERTGLDGSPADQRIDRLSRSLSQTTILSFRSVSRRRLESNAG